MVSNPRLKSGEYTPHFNAGYYIHNKLCANNNYITTAQVNWDNIGAWTISTQYNSPNISSVIQELVNQGSWTSGDYIGLWFDDYDGRSANTIGDPMRRPSISTTPSQLKITYSSGGEIEVLKYQPNTIISGTTLLDSDGTENGVITWGTNTGVTISVGTPSSGSSPTYNGNASGALGDQLSSSQQGYKLPTITMPANWYGNNALSGLPLYGVFLGVANSTGIPVRTLYVIIMFLVAFMIFFYAVMKTHSIMMSGAVFVLLLAMESGTGVIPGWIVYVIGIGSIGILFLARQIG